MSYLDELTGLKKTAEVVLRGEVKVTVRGLTMDETRAAQDAFDAPVAPLVKNPNAGSAAAWVPDTQNQGYVAAVRCFDDSVKGACVALATGVVALSGRWDEDKKALAAASALVRGRMHDAEVNALLVKMHEMSSVARGVEAALGNSSAPPK